MANVTREDFVKALKASPAWVGKPVEGQTISAMQYVDEKGHVRAQAIYSSPVRGVKVIPSYTITD